MQSESFQVQVLVFMLILACNVLAAYFIDKNQISLLHQSTLVIFLGLLTGIILKLTLGKQIVFSNQIFFALLLPPIVFSVGYAIKTHYFFEYIGTIVILGIFSTIISITLFTAALTFIDQHFLDLFATNQILLLAVILSTKDPIATLPLLKENHPKLNAIASGQSVINSAVCIILFGVIASQTAQNQIFDFDFVANILWIFSYRLVFSFLLGFFFGLGLSLLFKRMQSFSQFPIKQTSLILLNGYMVYLIGQLLQLSGIFALFTTAIVFSLYGFKNLSEQSRHGTGLAFETVRYVSQSFIFAYLGASLPSADSSFSAIVVAFVLMLMIPLIRLLSSFFVPLFYRITSKAFPVSSGEKKMLWYCGLGRGVIAFALSLQIQCKNKKTMVAIALVIVMATTILTTSLLRLFAEKVGLDQLSLLVVGARPPQKSAEMMPATKYEIIGGLEQMTNVSPSKLEKFKSFEQKFIKPIFIKGQANNVQNTKIFIEK